MNEIKETEKLKEILQIKDINDSILETVTIKNIPYYEALTLYIENRFNGMKIKDIPQEDLEEFTSNLSTPIKQRIEEEFININLIKFNKNSLPI